MDYCHCFAARLPYRLGGASLTDICHDWEFFEDGETIKPISVGMKASDGDEYYAIFYGASELCSKSEWLYDNVGQYFRHPHAVRNFKPHSEIVGEVVEFIRSKEDPQLWADHSAYDHVLLAQTIGGPMINMPSGIPWFTHDIRTIEALVHKRGNPGRRWLKENEPKQDPTSVHHALHDARHDMELLNYFSEHARRGW